MKKNFEVPKESLTYKAPENFDVTKMSDEDLAIVLIIIPATGGDYFHKYDAEAAKRLMQRA